MKNTTLILIDIQNDYFAGGALTLENPIQAADKAGELLSLFRANNMPVVHIIHENLNPDLPFMLPGTDGQKIYPSLAPIENETVITKNFPNSFWKTELEAALNQQESTQIIIAGMMTHMCVSTTTRGAMERGFEAIVIQDACATKSLELDGIEIPAETVHQTALAELTLLAKIMPLENFVSESSLKGE